MAKALLIAWRDPKRRSITEEQVRKLATALAPDNISPREPLVFSDEQDLVAVFQPSPSWPPHEGNVAVGTLLKPAGEWWTVGGDIPEGSFALYRRDAKYVELVTDMLACRSVWYALTPEMFVASSSQRAVIACLRSFDPDPNALAWMLSQGSIGLGNSWDRRIRPLRWSSRLRLDRVAWSLTVESEPIQHAPEDRTYEEAKAALASVIDSAVARLDGDMQHTLLLLTGGTDSRFILYGMMDRGVKTLTWGLSDDLKRRHSDAWLAVQLAKRYHLNHEFRSIDEPVTESVDTILSRYVALSEACADNFTGYLDGMRIYKQFYEEGVESMVRGEAAVGYYALDDEFEIRRRFELFTLADYSNLSGSWMKQFASQAIPDELRRRPDESLTTWCDRLLMTEKLPKQMAALNEIKTWYCEIHNPLMARSVVAEGLRQTDAQRGNRKLHHDIVHDRCPDLEFARDVTPSRRKRGVLRTRPYVDVMRATLDTGDARELLSPDLVDFLLTNLSEQETEGLTRKRLRAQITRYLPEELKKLLRRAAAPSDNRPKMDFNVLAFRAFLAVRMHRLLRADAKLLS